MHSRIVIIGAGFAGVWSALAAKRLITLRDKQEDIEVYVVAPAPDLIIRPRLYEANASDMSHPLKTLFSEAGINFVQGTVNNIDTQQRKIGVCSASVTESSIQYTRLILAAGSNVARPQKVVGLQQYGFDIDSLHAATALESHLRGLASLPSSLARDTIVVCGAGFTGIELATELPGRLGQAAGMRFILVESADEVGPELGQGPRPVITKALRELGIEVRLGSAVKEVDAEGITLASGERIETLTAIWTAGVEATPLTMDIPGKRDAFSRLYVDEYLRVPSSPEVFIAGDAASALADTNGHRALMSCQHALVLGRASGHNAIADVLAEPMMPYSQPAYNCCLDLGGWGAVVASGWEREVRISGDLAKRIKGFINQRLIYPPQNAKEAIAAADPNVPDSDELFRQMLATVS
ncbi:FAD/NAD(P)-binding domain-containing protein [Polychaeton citri CBS 116435]|uniref:FAD/NAD(P)-binding domain-containing protein n=1 Tax=Polychaeton citri CBS 116435 TaxID=1314669 RepID=A0A9P4QGT4_9PEZI|nr:FAD/NAD(P)-binding domain-containing protein [Polychaeton citri CBS 116435]